MKKTLVLAVVAIVANFTFGLKIGIIGGSFDPPGTHHMLLGAELLNLRKVDRVVYIPCGQRTDKQLTASSQQRLEMLTKSVNDYFD